MKHAPIALILSLLTLSSCGTHKADRAMSGGLIGAGTGAVIGSAVGSPFTGAVIGAGVGAATGALTDPDTIDIGTPFWRR